jgi:hypothetical protein
MCYFRRSSSLLLTISEFVGEQDRQELCLASWTCLSDSTGIIVHTSDRDATASDLGELYEPRGRMEAHAGPQLNARLTELATKRLAELPGWLPDEFEFSSWFVFAYGPEQYIIPHADGSSYLGGARRQLAALTLWLQVPDKGGEFYVHADPFVTDWSGDIRTGLDPTTSTYEYSSTPRWTLGNLESGDAVLFGSELVHGTNAVVHGVALKVLGFITVDERSFVR